MSALHWNPVRVAALLDEHDIISRDELAARVPGVSRSSVYRAFDADWCGTANVRTLVALCKAFDAPMAALVHEPRGRR